MFMDPDPETARAFFRDKPRAQVDKQMTVAEAVAAVRPRRPLRRVGRVRHEPHRDCRDP